MTGTGISHDSRSYRLTSIDMLRGLVIVIMALDHVRDSFMEGTVQDPMNQPGIAVSLYLTRWVTHFCAPVFIFLADTSAGLMTARKTSGELGAFLSKRGLWLIFVCVFILSTATTFSPLGMEEMGGAILVILNVIWAIGASMVLLAAAQFLGARTCLYLGALILLGHNLLDPLWPAPDLRGGDSSPLAILFYQGSFILKPLFILEVYPIFAWFGVMLLGFGSAFIFEKENTKRDQTLIGIGTVFIIVFFSAASKRALRRLQPLASTGARYSCHNSRFYECLQIPT